MRGINSIFGSQRKPHLEVSLDPGDLKAEYTRQKVGEGHSRLGEQYIQWCGTHLRNWK